MLTDSLIRALRPTKTTVRKPDSGGLYLEVSPAGTKSFRLAYRFGGKQRTLLVGRYPDTRLADARLLREQAKDLLRRGTDPAGILGDRCPPVVREPAPVSATLEVPPENLFRNVALDYLAKRRREGAAPKTMQKLAFFMQTLISAFGEKEIHRIRASDVIAALRPFEEKGLLHSVAGLRVLASQVFRFAIAHDLLEHDPARDVADALARPVAGGYSGITAPERVGELMRSLYAYQGDPTVRVGLLLSAYLFPRSGEIRAMRWDQVDTAARLRTVPARQMKMKREHLVPLPRQALELLAQLRPRTGQLDLVLPSPQAKSRMLSENTFNAALRRMGYPSHEHVHHGFRITASTNLNEQGWNPDWIERQLAHLPGNQVRGIYNKALYLAGRHEMMQAYADWLDAKTNL